MKDLGKYAKENTDKSKISMSGLNLAVNSAAVAWDGFNLAYKTVNQALEIGTSIQTAMKAATIGTTAATGALSGTTGIATAAQWLWNAALNANPIGLVIVAVAALAAAIMALSTWLNKETEEEKKNREEIEKSVQKTNELCEANKNLNSSIADGQKQRSESLGQVEAETKASQKLTISCTNSAKRKINQLKKRLRCRLLLTNSTKPCLT